MKRYTHLIWDFNGTLLDDLDITIRSANRLLRSHGLTPLPDVASYHRVFGFPIKEYYRRLGFDFDATPYEDLAVEWVGYYREEYARDARVFEDIPEVLRRVRELGIRQFILSATERKMLREQVTDLGILRSFDELLGLDDIHAGGKTEIGIAWKAEHPDAVPLFLGDTDHDAEVARAMGADCVLIDRGHQPRATLEGCPCLAILPDARSVLKLLEPDD